MTQKKVFILQLYTMAAFFIFLLFQLLNVAFGRLMSIDLIIGSESDTNTVRLFEPGIISTPLNELNATFSPDGSLLLFTVANHSASHTFYTLFMSIKKDGQWRTPEIAPFSGQYSDADPFFSPNGKKLYFISRRPVSLTKLPKQDFDIWCVDYDNGIWATPIHLNDSVNSVNDELYPSVTLKGNLYFSRETDNNYDIMMCSATSEGFGSAVRLRGDINTGFTEYDAYVSPDETYIIFTAIGRPDGMGSGDLYVSYDTQKGWSKGRNLGASVNSPFMDQCPSVSPDGKTLLFTSFRDHHAFAAEKPFSTSEYLNVLSSPFNGSGNLFWTPAKKLLHE